MGMMPKPEYVEYVIFSYGIEMGRGITLSECLKKAKFYVKVTYDKEFDIVCTLKNEFAKNDYGSRTYISKVNSRKSGNIGIGFTDEEAISDFINKETKEILKKFKYTFLKAYYYED